MSLHERKRIDLAFKILADEHKEDLTRFLERLGLIKPDERVVVLGPVEVEIARAPLSIDYALKDSRIIAIEVKSEAERVDSRELYMITFRTLALCYRYDVDVTDVLRRATILVIVPYRRNLLARYRSMLRAISEGVYALENLPLPMLFLVVAEMRLPKEMEWLKITYSEGRMELALRALREKDTNTLAALLVTGDLNVIRLVMQVDEQAVREAWSRLAKELGPERIARTLPPEVIMSRDVWRALVKEFGLEKVARTLPPEILTSREAWRALIEELGPEKIVRALPLEVLASREFLRACIQALGPQRFLSIVVSELSRTKEGRKLLRELLSKVMSESE